MTKEVKEVDYLVSNHKVQCVFDIAFSDIPSRIEADRILFLTDENIYGKYGNKFPLSDTIIIPAGEENKNIETVMKVIDELQLKEAGRDVFILGVGGGVVTDIAGFVASIYLRGVRFGLVPTTVLAMVDAAVGGKNGVNVDMMKNQIGVIRQPEFLFYDFQFLDTLPDLEWVSGFAEVIKHSCIRDAEMFQFLMNNSLDELRKDHPIIQKLIQQNVAIKFDIVTKDETESGQRRLLNFGHTIGHAVENILKIPHGFAVSLGIVYACRISERVKGFSHDESEAVIHLLQKYHLPVATGFDKEKAWEMLIHDKKKSGDYLYFILLDEIGNAHSQKLPLSELKKIFFEL